MTNQTRLCPICRRPVTQTRGHNIAAHLDKAGRPCPASNELPYTHTIEIETPRLTRRRQR